MEYQVIWLEPALLDLNQQVEFLAEETSLDDALNFSDEVLEFSEGLRLLPHRGRALSIVGQDYRELLYERTFRLVYRIDAGVIEIVAFIHTSRDFPAAWRSRRR